MHCISFLKGSLPGPGAIQGSAVQVQGLLVIAIVFRHQSQGIARQSSRGKLPCGFKPFFGLYEQAARFGSIAQGIQRQA